MSDNNKKNHKEDVDLVNFFSEEQTNNPNSFFQNTVSSLDSFQNIVDESSYKPNLMENSGEEIDNSNMSTFQKTSPKSVDLESQSNNKEEKVPSQSGGYFLAFFSFVVIGICIYFIFKGLPLNLKDNQLENQYTGIYQLGETTVKLYTRENGDLLFSISNTSTIKGIAALENNTLEAIVDNQRYSFSLKKDNLNLDTNNTSVDSGVYYKVREYSKNEFYSDWYGDFEFLNSKYNGKYYYKNFIIYIFQISEDNVRVYAQDENKNTLINYNFKIQLDDSLFYEDALNKYYISIDNNQLSINTTQGKLDGLYEIQKKIVIEDIIENVD